MEALGRLFNIVPVAGGEFIDLKDAEGITFIVSAATAVGTGTITSSASDDGTGPANVQVTRYYLNADSDGTEPWTLVEAAANHVVTPGDTGFVASVHVPASRLAPGHRYIGCAVSNATVVAIVHDLAEQRTPPNLPPLVAS